MAVKVIGVFDSTDEANRVRERLSAEGIPASDISTGPDEGTMSSSTTTTTTTTSGEHEQGFFAWLKSLFTDDDDEYAHRTSEAVRRGSCVVAVSASDDAQAERVERVMQDCGAIDVDQRAERWRAEGWTRFDASQPRLAGADLDRERQLNTEHERIPVVREDIQVGKREVMRGGVRVVTRVVERPVEEQVTLREEHAHIERHAADRPATEAELRGMKGGTIEITERAEEPVVAKTSRVVEEIEVGKQVGTRTETVRDTVRETKVEVEQMAAKNTGEAGRQQSGTVTGGQQPGATPTDRELRTGSGPTIDPTPGGVPGKRQQG